MHHSSQTSQDMTAQWIASRWAPQDSSQRETKRHFPHFIHSSERTWKDLSFWAIFTLLPGMAATRYGLLVKTQSLQHHHSWFHTLAHFSDFTSPLHFYYWSPLLPCLVSRSRSQTIVSTINFLTLHEDECGSTSGRSLRAKSCLGPVWLFCLHNPLSGCPAVKTSLLCFNKDDLSLRF